MTKFALIINKEGNEDIRNINQAIETCNQASSSGMINAEILDNLIKAIDIYIQKIPLSIRSKSIADSEITWEEKLKDFPQAVEILNLQKKAVTLRYLPDAETEAKARWLLIKRLISKNVIDISLAGKMMDPEYWGEARFEGSTFIYNWLNNISYDDEHNFRSFHELLEHNQKIEGMGRNYTTYLEYPEQYKLQFKDGVFYFNGSPIDSTHSSGAEIKSGEVIFVVGKDGAIYTSNPDKYLDTIFHHSSFLKGKSVVCAGTMKFKDGKLIEITTSSGHYQPNAKNLLNFLDILKNKYHLDLNEIRVKTHDSGFKNAAKFYKTQGMCLPDDKAELMWELAAEAYREQNEDDLHYFIDKAVELGHEEALFNKATLMAREIQGYNGQKNEGIELLERFVESRSFFFRAQIVLQEVSPTSKNAFASFHELFPKEITQDCSQELHADEKKVGSSQELNGDEKKCDFSQELHSIINEAYIKYNQWIQLKSGGSMSVGFFNPHGKDGIRKALHLVDKSRDASFPEIVNLIQDFFSDNLKDKGDKKFSNKARANNHSFISFLLNELKDNEDVVAALAEYSTDGNLQTLIDSSSDYTKSSSKETRNRIFKIFSSLERSEEQLLSKPH